MRGPGVSSASFQRALRTRPGRRAAFALLLALPLIGASIGAALNPRPTFRSQAVAALAIAPGKANLERYAAHKRTRLRLVVKLARSDIVRKAVASSTPLNLSLGQLAQLTRVEADEEAGVATFLARGRSASAAVALANAYAVHTLDLVQRTVPRRRDALILGDFEHGLGAWATRDPRFGDLSPALAPDQTVARFGRTSLRAGCWRDSPCGVAAPVYYPFRESVAYTASAWIRASPSASVTFALGANRRDLSKKRVGRRGPAWGRIWVTWTPAEDSGRAEVTLRVQSPGPITLHLDGVLLSDPSQHGSAAPGAPPDVAAERRFFAREQLAGLVPARSVRPLDGDTLRSAAIGGLVGLIAALASVLAGWLAHRRA